MRVTPRVSVPFQTPFGTAYVGANMRPNTQRRTASQQAPTQARPVGFGPATMYPVQQRRPSPMAYIVMMFGMLLVFFFAMVVVCLAAIAFHIIPATPATTTHAPTGSPTISASTVAHSPSKIIPAKK